ncbi:MAG TPA: di-heme oxidoredictase family protein, partial [Polyangiaceae bacterium]|nr:di-heme oxidoredictase family protein [Polyangiaceae bacterium]
MINPSKSRTSAQRALVCAIATCGVACNEPTYTPFYDSADLADGGPQVNNDAGASASPSTADGKPSQTPMPATRGSNTDSPATSDDEARPTSEPAAPTQAGRPTPDTGENPNDAGPAAPIPTQPSSNSTAEIGDACLSESPVPTSFERNCAGCHNDAGEQIGSAPNLFTFEGTADEFQQRVRMGGERMPSFDTQTLSDDDLSAIVDFFEAPINDANSETSTACAGKALVGDTCSGVTVPIVPLYASAEAGDTAQILTTNSDGSLVLRAGGRVRGRHEHEADFSPFHTQYFEHRSYTFIVEDTIPAGGNTIKVTWLPIADAAADQVINLRYWYTGDGNVFHTNVGMTRIEPMHWEHTADHNARDDREIRIGDRFDFEFGVFYDPDQVDGRTSYYSDTFRYVVGSGKLTAFDSPDDRAKSGGDTTIPYIFVEPELYFEQMALNIQGDDAQRFLEGRRLFHTDFVTGEHTDPNNPPFEEQASKAGPLANQTSCSGCHEHNGRGAPPASGEAAETLVFKTFDASSTSDAPLPAPKYGRQLQTLSQDGFDPEGQVNVTFTAETFSLPDGDEVELQRPSYVWDGDPSLLSPRLPRPVIGLGLLEAISEQTLLGLADAEDCNADGISGRPNLVPDPATGDLRLGRFGWKAGKVSVR